MSGHRFIEELHAGKVFQGFCVERNLFSAKTPYQAIEIIETDAFGRVLILDGVVQTTERDEFVYHEMLVHVPMFACATPRRVLIIGGGDGGSLREVLRHDIEAVDMIEIDEAVVTACPEHLPSLNNGGEIYRDPRVNLVIEDAFVYLKRENRRYDVIISDSTDPIGAGAVLFSDDYYRLCADAITDTGAMSFQDGVPFLQPEELRQTMRSLRGLGLHATCYQAHVPSYYGGAMALAFATRDAGVFTHDLATVERRNEAYSIPFKHYSPAHHVASFALPRWIQALTEE